MNECLPASDPQEAKRQADFDAAQKALREFTEQHFNPVVAERERLLEEFI